MCRVYLHLRLTKIAWALVEQAEGDLEGPESDCDMIEHLSCLVECCQSSLSRHVQKDIAWTLVKEAEGAVEGTELEYGTIEHLSRLTGSCLPSLSRHVQRSFVQHGQKNRRRCPC